MARAKRPRLSTALVLPELIQGQWTSLTVLTYGADLTFFDAHLLRQLSQVPLRIILADSVRLAETLRAAAANGQSHRHANRSYVIAPIRHSRAAHAKIILMASKNAGRLLIGSGNLGQDGYATPGELWHIYGYDDTNTRFVDEFAAVRRFIDSIATDQLLDPPVCEALSTAWGQAPWLIQAPVGETAIRTNQATPLAAQLVDAVSALGAPVDELTVYAPFYDTGAKALRFLLDALTPSRIRVLLRRDTSVNPKALMKVLRGAHSQLFEVTVRDDDAYIHAKWIHAATAHGHVLLTGSPNLSAPALLSDWTTGNIEAGIIQRLADDEVDELYQALVLTPVDDISSWELEIQPPDVVAEPTGPRLLWSQLQGQQLRLAFTAAFDVSLLGLSADDGVALTIKSANWNSAVLTVTLDANQAESVVKQGGPISVRIGGPDAAGNEPEPVATWPYQLEQLASRLKTAAANRLLDKVGSLPDADKELYELLMQLEQSLIFDPITAWKTVHPDSPPPPSDEAGANLAWKDIDWSKLKRSARFSAYQYRTSPGIARTDIEVILASMSAQLGKLPRSDEDDAGEEADLANESSELVADPEQAEEREAGDAADYELTTGLSVSTRTRMAFGRFVKRFASSIVNDEFVNELGPTVTVHNAVIVHHILNRLLERDGVDSLAAADAHLAIWKRLWGDGTTPGLLASLDPSERSLADDLIRKGRLRENALEALLNHTYDEHVLAQRQPEFREQARHFAQEPEFALDAELCQNAAPTYAKSAVEQLWMLASRLSDSEVRAFVLTPLGVSATAGRWDFEPVKRSAGDSSRKVRILTLTQPVPGLEGSAAVATLARLAMTSWYNHERHRDYWRIRFAEPRTMCFWDERALEGLCLVGGEEIELDDLDLPWPAWWIRYEELHSALSDDVAA